MDHPIPGDLYSVRNIPRNRMNGLKAGLNAGSRILIPPMFRSP